MIDEVSAMLTSVLPSKVDSKATTIYVTVNGEKRPVVMIEPCHTCNCKHSVHRVSSFHSILVAEGHFGGMGAD